MDRITAACSSAVGESVARWANKPDTSMYWFDLIWINIAPLRYLAVINIVPVDTRPTTPTGVRHAAAASFIHAGAPFTLHNKLGDRPTDIEKLSCRREAARAPCRWKCCSHSRSLWGHSELHRWVSRSPISISLQLCIYFVPFLRYSTLNNSMTLNSWLGIIQGHWQWHQSIDSMRIPNGVSK